MATMLDDGTTYLGRITITTNRTNPTYSICTTVYDDVALLKREYIHPGQRLIDVAKELMDSVIQNGDKVLSLRIDRSDYFF